MGEILSTLIDNDNYPKHHAAIFGQTSFDIMNNGKEKDSGHI